MGLVSWFADLPILGDVSIILIHLVLLVVLIDSLVEIIKTEKIIQDLQKELDETSEITRK